MWFQSSQRGFAVGDGGVVLHTNNAGGTWHLATAEAVDYRQVTFLDEQFGWATYRYGSDSWGVAATNDGGRHRRRLNESFVYGTWPVYAVFLTPEHGYAVSMSLYETRDGGIKWRRRNGGRRSDEVSFEYLGLARDGTLVPFGRRAGRLTPFVSQDGDEWEESNTKPPL